MTIPESIELFSSLMMNEIFNSCAPEEIKDDLVRALKDVEKTVTDTYHAEQKK